MDSLELTKITAAVLLALLVMVGSKTFFEIAAAPHDDHGVVGFELPKPEPEEAQVADAGGEAGGEAAAEAGFDAAAVAALVDAASAEKGEGVFKGCRACHSAEQGGANKVGPALWGVYDRDIASADGFSYSDALAGKEGGWTAEQLAGFLHNPKEWAPGTKMIYRGVSDNQKLADLIAYLKTLK